MKDRIGYIYVIENIHNGMKYVGQTIVKPIYRYSKHICDSLKQNSNQPVHKAIRELGVENFKFYVVETCTSSNINEREKFWITKLNAVENGYNVMLSSGIDEQDKIEIIDLYTNGKTIRQISKLKHVDTKTVSKLLQLNNIDTTIYTVNYGHKERFILAKEMYLSGISLRQIEKEIHIDRKLLSKQLKEEGFIVNSYMGKDAHPYKKVVI